MQTPARSRQPILRHAALVLALLCLWISGGATLHHTDDLSVFRTFAAGHDGLRHVTAPFTHAPCAACEWEQTVPTLHTPTLAVTCLPLLRTVQASALPATLHLRRFDHSAPRAPPTLS